MDDTKALTVIEKAIDMAYDSGRKSVKFSEQHCYDIIDIISFHIKDFKVTWSKEYDDTKDHIIRKMLNKLNSHE